MMKFFTAMACACILATGAHAATNDDGPTYGPLYSIFSTSTDWQGVTGLSLSEYRGTFLPDRKLIGNKGLVLYYLDGFPCYGLGSWVRTWISPAGKPDQHLRIACVHAPTEIKFAWRNAAQDATEAATTGLLTCPVTTTGREIIINLAKCTRDKEWREYDR